MGAVGIIVAARGAACRSTGRAALLIVALAALFSVALAIVMHPALYNGLRHFVFVVPPFARARRPRRRLARRTAAPVRQACSAR